MVVEAGAISVYLDLAAGYVLFFWFSTSNVYLCVFMLINEDKSFPITTIVMTYILSVSIQLLCRYILGVSDGSRRLMKIIT